MSGLTSRVPHPLALWGGRPGGGVPGENGKLLECSKNPGRSRQKGFTGLWSLPPAGAHLYPQTASAGNWLPASASFPGSAYAATMKPAWHQTGSRYLREVGLGLDRNCDTVPVPQCVCQSAK